MNEKIEYKRFMEMLLNGNIAFLETLNDLLVFEEKEISKLEERIKKLKLHNEEIKIRIEKEEIREAEKMSKQLKDIKEHILENDKILKMVEDMNKEKGTNSFEILTNDLIEINKRLKQMACEVEMEEKNGNI